MEGVDVRTILVPQRAIAAGDLDSTEIGDELFCRTVIEGSAVLPGRTLDGLESALGLEQVDAEPRAKSGGDEIRKGSSPAM